MTEYTIKYDERNSKAQKLIEFLLSLDFLKLEKKEDECPYDKEFMQKIDRARKQKSTGKAIATEDLWK